MSKSDKVNLKKIQECQEFILENFGNKVGPKVLVSTLTSVTNEDFQDIKNKIGRFFPNNVEYNKKTFDCMDMLRGFNAVLEKNKKQTGR